MTFGLAIAAFGFYTGAFGEIANYSYQDNSTVTTDIQDTLPGRKKDTTNRRPMPQDTVRRDSAKTALLQIANK